MKRYIFFYALALINCPLKSMHRNLEIAINTHGTAIIGEDVKGKHRLFVPITLYQNGTIVRGGFMPWKALCDADDGDEVIDKYRNKKKEKFRCNQANASYHQKTFKQALTEVIQKEN